MHAVPSRDEPVPGAPRVHCHLGHGHHRLLLVGKVPVLLQVEVPEATGHAQLHVAGRRGDLKDRLAPLRRLTHLLDAVSEEQRKSSGPKT